MPGTSNMILNTCDFSGSSGLSSKTYQEKFYISPLSIKLELFVFVCEREILYILLRKLFSILSLVKMFLPQMYVNSSNVFSISINVVICTDCFINVNFILLIQWIILVALLFQTKFEFWLLVLLGHNVWSFLQSWECIS